LDTESDNSELIFGEDTYKQSSNLETFYTKSENWELQLQSVQIAENTISQPEYNVIFDLQSEFILVPSEIFNTIIENLSN